MEPIERSILGAFEHWASTTPDRPFIQWQDGQPQSYAQFQERVRRLAGGLEDLGVSEGDTVLIMLPNGFEIVEAWLAVNSLGAVQVPINTFLRGAFLQHIVDDSQATVMIVDAASVSHVASLDQPDRLRTVVVVGEIPDVVPGRATAVPYEMAIGSPAMESSRPHDFGDLCAIYYT